MTADSNGAPVALQAAGCRPEDVDQIMDTMENLASSASGYVLP
jgi:hypothetical protein